MRFLVDENLLRSITQTLRAAGDHVTDIRDVGLRGAMDKEIFDYIFARDFILFTRDLDFTNTIEYPLGKYPGILVLRLPETFLPENLARVLLEVLQKVPGECLRKGLVVVEPNKIRVRQSPGQ